MLVASVQMLLCSVAALDAARHVLMIRYILMKRPQEAGSGGRLQKSALARAGAVREQVQRAFEWYRAATRVCQEDLNIADPPNVADLSGHKPDASAQLWLEQHVLHCQDDGSTAVRLGTEAVLGAGAALPLWDGLQCWYCRLPRHHLQTCA